MISQRKFRYNAPAFLAPVWHELLHKELHHPLGVQRMLNWERTHLTCGARGEATICAFSAKTQVGLWPRLRGINSTWKSRGKCCQVLTVLEVEAMSLSSSGPSGSKTAIQRQRGVKIIEATAVPNSSGPTLSTTLLPSYRKLFGTCGRSWTSNLLTIFPKDLIIGVNCLSQT